mgnify:FL=1
MIDRFRSFIEIHQLIPPGGKTLLAVSGGIDSMAMWKLFETAGREYGVIHCNFSLRGEDSDDDERLVRDHAAEVAVQLYVKRFDTLDYARVKGISVEMAARELRYNWFEEIRSAEGYDVIATAHHQDDLIETFFINLIRKTGIRGLSGFREKSGNLIRPMLFTCRKEIEAWAKEACVVFREDHTNNEVVFQRNYIRHEILPRLEDLNPSFRSNLTETMGNLRQTEEFFNTEINRQIRKIALTGTENSSIYTSELLKLPHPRQVLFEWMSRFGFNSATVDSVWASLAGEPGKRWFSVTHRLVIDRNQLIITPQTGETEQLFYIEEEDLEIRDPLHLQMELLPAKGFTIIRDPAVACLDGGNLDFPLIIRKWKPGEYFQPLGMSGFKKISDYFTDEKFSLPEKEETWILYSGNKVVWIIGSRIDHRFRVTPETRKILKITLLK